MLFVIKSRYKKEVIHGIDKNNHKLIKLYGISMFLADVPLKKIVERNTKKINSAFCSLEIKEHTEKEKYLYVVSKIATTYLIIMSTLFLCICLEISNDGQVESLDLIERNAYGEGEREYILDMICGEKETKVNIVVPQKVYTKDECTKIIEDSKQNIIDEMLGENRSADYVTKPLNLINTYGDNGISIEWEIDRDDIVDYEGNIINSVSESGEKVTLTATISIRDMAVVENIELNVFPGEYDENIQNYLQHYIDDYDATDKNIKLPQEVDGETVEFYDPKEEQVMPILIIGIIMGIVAFVLKDNDLEKNMKKRDRQLVADYSEIINKILLYSKTGIAMKSAWEKTVQSCGNKKDHYVYKEMNLTLMKIKSGVSEQIAYEQFGRRCGLHSYIRFSNIINQNLKRGTANMTVALKAELNNALLERKNNALKIGEEAGTKLMGPMIIMLIVGLVMIVVPALMSINV